MNCYPCSWLMRAVFPRLTTVTWLPVPDALGESNELIIYILSARCFAFFLSIGRCSADQWRYWLTTYTAHGWKSSAPRLLLGVWGSTECTQAWEVLYGKRLPSARAPGSIVSLKVFSTGLGPFRFASLISFKKSKSRMQNSGIEPACCNNN
jgi:hypothetical protein